jgi:hypothetical protein
MGFIELILSIALVGLLVWAVINYIPMPEAFRRAIMIVSVIALIIYVANALGMVHELPAHLR